MRKSNANNHKSINRFNNFDCNVILWEKFYARLLKQIKKTFGKHGNIDRVQNNVLNKVAKS